MPSFLTMFTLASIITQTSISIMISWLTLDCKFQPSYEELQEVTITKLLYLYDPQACGRVYFYNYTQKLRETLSTTSVEWAVKNEVAAAFRQKIKLWVTLHTLWLVFCVAYMTQGHRPCAFYTALLPFTLTGLIILVVDILFAALFLADTAWTGTEQGIIDYINADNQSVFRINKTSRSKPFSKIITTPLVTHDTSWISLLLAYVSIRGVVLWIFNFWMIKDNYFEGLAIFRHSQNVAEREAKLKKSTSNSILSVDSVNMGGSSVASQV